MNILQVSHSFYPCFQAGGVVKVVYDLSRMLVKKGHNVTVVTTDGCTKRLNIQKNIEVDVLGVKVWYFQNISNFLRIKFKVATPYLLPFYLRKHIRNFDIIHIHEHRTILALITCYYAQKFNIPYIVQTHGDLKPIKKRRILRYFFDKIWGQRILQNARKIIALTNTEHNQVQKHGIDSERISIIPNAIILSDYENLPPYGYFKRTFGIRENKKIVTYLGRIHESKGIDLLVRAFQLLQKNIDDVILVIAGPDEGFMKELHNLVNKTGIENQAILTGPMNSAEKLALLHDTDVFVTPKFSGFPITFLEACVCGVPIVTTNYGDNLDWINDNCGYVVNPNPKEISYAIQAIISNECNQLIKSEKNRQKIKARFSWDHIILRFEKIYEDNRKRG